MRLHRANRRLATWIALVAMLLASLAPSVSHALGASRGASWVEVCSTQGSRWVQDDRADSNGAPTGLQATEHCPCCSVHAPVLGLPPTGPTALPVPSRADAMPPVFLAARRTLRAWASAQPRAPPPLS